MERKAVSNIVSIDSARIGPDTQPPAPATAKPVKRSSSNFMTRRVFTGLFFGMGHSFHTAVRKSGITRTAASEEAFEYGYEEWARRTGRKAA